MPAVNSTSQKKRREKNRNPALLCALTDSHGPETTSRPIRGDRCIDQYLQDIFHKVTIRVIICACACALPSYACCTSRRSSQSTAPATRNCVSRSGTEPGPPPNGCGDGRPRRHQPPHRLDGQNGNGRRTGAPVAARSAETCKCTHKHGSQNRVMLHHLDSHPQKVCQSCRMNLQRIAHSLLTASFSSQRHVSTKQYKMYVQLAVSANCIVSVDWRLLSFLSANLFCVLAVTSWVWPLNLHSMIANSYPFENLTPTSAAACTLQ